MSVPYNLLQNAAGGHIPASQRVPTIARPFLSERAAKTLDIVSPLHETGNQSSTYKSLDREVC